MAKKKVSKKVASRATYVAPAPLPPVADPAIENLKVKRKNVNARKLELSKLQIEEAECRDRQSALGPLIQQAEKRLREARVAMDEALDSA